LRRAKALGKPGQTVRSIDLMTVPGQKVNQLIAQDALVFSEDDVGHVAKSVDSVAVMLAEQT
jgi:hypothetical protein